MIPLPSRSELEALLEEYVADEYQRHHARMVAVVMVGYARHFGKDENLWYATGILHDLDFDRHPREHPGPSIRWFTEWGYPTELIHAVEAHACGYNRFTTEPQTRLAAALMACDEICGIFYAYQKLNPVPYKEMKSSSIKKRLAEKTFAAKIDRETIYKGCALLNISLEDHIANLIKFLPD